MPISPGIRLGPYEILAPIGAGGMGEVYRARDTRLNRDVAVKILPAEVSDDPGRRQRFELEARAVAALNHPNIVAIYDVGENYIVSEFIDGESLRGAKFGLRKTIDIAVQIASGLAAAHDAGIIHRDLKPGNILLTHDGRAKILDFGLAKVTAPRISATSDETLTVRTEPGIVMGTVGYMSPEQIRGLELDARSDIFSLGAILYEMLTGGRAFQGPSSVDIMSAILKEDVEISESDARFPPSLARIVRRCLEKSPNERFESARDLAFALQAVSPSPGPMGASSAQPAVPTPQFRRRALWVIAALAAAAMLGGIYYLGGRQTTPVSLHFQRKNFPSGYVTSARFTNDGQTIIYSAAWGQKPNQLYSTRRESSESHAFDVGDATILAVSQRGEMALLLNSHYVGWEPGIGTLAEAPILGGAPHEISENVRWAGFNPDGSALAVVRKNGDHYRVEYPLGTVLLDTSETIDRIHVLPNDEGVWVRAGARTILTLDRRGSRRVLFSEPSGNIWPAEFPGRREIWLTTIDGNGNSTLIAVPFSGRQRKIADLTGSLQLFDISKDGQMLLQGIDERTELVYRGPGDTADRDMSWLGRSIAEDISADGRVILFNDAPSEKYATYIRRRDESAPVRLGDAYGTSLSSDGRTVAGMATYPGRLLLLPVGAGQIRQPATGNVKTVMWVKWLPDNKRVLYLGSEPGKGARYYVQDIASDVSRAISLEGVSVLGSFPVSPDGKWVALTDPDGKISRYPIDGGPPQALTTGAAGDAPSAWSADGRFLYHYLLKRPPTTIRRLDLTTARDEDWRPLVPPNLTGALFIAPVAITPDGQSYAYSIRRRLTQFYIADTLKEAFR